MGWDGNVAVQSKPCDSTREPATHCKHLRTKECPKDGGKSEGFEGLRSQWVYFPLLVSVSKQSQSMECRVPSAGEGLYKAKAHIAKLLSACMEYKYLKVAHRNVVSSYQCWEAGESGTLSKQEPTSGQTVLGRRRVALGMWGEGRGGSREWERSQRLLLALSLSLSLALGSAGSASAAASESLRGEEVPTREEEW